MEMGTWTWRHGGMETGGMETGGMETGGMETWGHGDMDIEIKYWGILTFYKKSNRKLKPRRFSLIRLLFLIV
jgi:hypothetical protein